MEERSEKEQRNTKYEKYVLKEKKGEKKEREIEKQKKNAYW